MPKAIQVILLGLILAAAGCAVASVPVAQFAPSSTGGGGSGNGGGGGNGASSGM
jgi:hypothetical protein